MRIHPIIIILFCVFIASPLFAQNNGETHLPLLSQDSYSQSDYLRKDYNYQLINKKRSLEMISKEVLTLGSTISLGLMVGNGLLANKYNWNLWVNIPLVTVFVVTPVITLFYMWSDHYQQKADAIVISPIVSINSFSQDHSVHSGLASSADASYCLNIGIHASF